jgi:hypothetical protein
MRVQILSDKPPGHYSDADARALLESAVQRVLADEGELRAATQQLEALVASCRAHGQADLVEAALRSLKDRRPA